MKPLDAAGRLHLLLLRALTGILGAFLIFTPISGLWMISQMRRYSVFQDFGGYVRVKRLCASRARF